VKKGIIIFILILSSNLCFGQEWQATESDGFFYLKNNTDEQLSCEITSVGGMPKFESVILIEKLKPVVLLKYFAGSSGTFIIIDEYWVVIYDPKTRKCHGDFPYQYLIHSDDKIIDQPKWTFSATSIRIVDEESSLDRNIEINK